MNIIIRPERLEDYNKIHEVISSAFNRDEEANMVNLLRKDKAFIPDLALVAELNDEIVGYILFSKIRVSNSKDFFHSLALAPVAVKPDYQNKHIGAKLILSGLDKAKDLGYQSVIVLGNDQYYPKFGFEPAKKWNIIPPFEVPSSYFMARELKKNSLKKVNGVVLYPDAFNMI